MNDSDKYRLRDECTFDPADKLTSRWKALPHFQQAYSEACSIVYVLGRNPKYGPSRKRNVSGRGYKGPPRFMDRFKSRQHAQAAITKVILRDKYGEVPRMLEGKELVL